MDGLDEKGQTSNEALQDTSSDNVLHRKESKVTEPEKEESSACLTKTSKETESDEVKRKEHLETDGVPYDTGWAWVVLCGVFVNYVVLAGYLKSLSLFYVELLDRYQASASKTALLFSIRAGVVSLCSPFAMTVAVGHLGIRKSALIGAAFMSLSGILSSFAKEMMLIVCLMAVFLGVGQSMLMSPGDVLLGTYFRRRRASALSLAKCGSSLGNMTLPVLVTFFLEKYGLSGTQLLMGGLCLQCLPAALLFRPTSFYNARKKRRGTVSAENHSDPAVGHKVEDPETRASAERISNGNNVLLEKAALWNSQPELSVFHRKSASCEQRRNVYDFSETGDWKISGIVARQLHIEACAVNEKGLSASDPLLVKATPRSPLAADQLVQRPRSTSVSDLYRKPSMTPDAECSSKPNESGGMHITQLSSALLKRLTRCPRNVFALDFSLFRSPLFRLLLAYYVLFNCPNIMLSYLPALAVENNVSEPQVALLLSMNGGLDLICRLFCAVLVNSRAIKASRMIVVAFFVQGVAAQFVRFMASFEHFVVLSVLLGLLGGVSNTFMSVLVLDFVGLDKMGKALGFVLLTLGASTAVLYPFLGFIRDITGSYAAVYHLVGGGTVLGAGLLCCENWVRRLEEKRTQSTDAEIHVL